MQTPMHEQLAKHYGRISRAGEVVSRCKMWLPPLLEGTTVLDLGCRRGKGVYHIAERVGADGKAIGLDWTSEFIEDARAHAAENVQFDTQGEPNIEFVVAFPEETGLPESSVDIVIMNSVFNLSYDLAAVLREVHRVLKPGGEFYLATVFAHSEIPLEVQARYLRSGNSFGCAPALSTRDSLFADAGFDAVFSFGFDQPIPAPADEFGDPSRIEFFEGVVRALKLGPSAETVDDAEQHVTYLAGEGAPDVFDLSDDWHFPAGAELAVPACVADALRGSRYANYFRVVSSSMIG